MPTQPDVHRTGLRIWLLLVPVLTALVLLLFRVYWWTTLIIVLLLACPIAIGLAIFQGLFRRPTLQIDTPDRSV